MHKGWICPKCGVVNAPWKDTCDCTKNYPNEHPVIKQTPFWPKEPSPSTIHPFFTIDKVWC